MFGAINSALWKANIFTSAFLTQLFTAPEFSAVTKTKFQEKSQLANTAVLGNLSNLTFNNLVIGRKYKVTLHYFAIWTATAIGVSQVSATCGVSLLAPRLGGSHNNGNFISTLASRTFIAQATTLTFSLDIANSISFMAGSYALLEELPNHDVVVDFT